MNATSSPFGPDFYKDLVSMMFKAMDDGTKTAYHMMWDMLLYFLIHDWLLVLGLLTFFLVIATTEFLFTGRWAMLGSVLYNYCYYGLLFLVGLIFGPEVFANYWIDLLLFAIYAVSFAWIGIILTQIGIRHR